MRQRHSALSDRRLRISRARPLLGTGRTVIVLLAAIGLIVGAAGLSIGGKPASAASTTWSTPVQIPVVGIGGNGTNQLKSISCASPTDCTAVGEDSDFQPFYVDETGGVWGTPTQVTSTRSFSTGFNSVSCTAVGDCTAVGTDTDAAIYDIETNGVWGPLSGLSQPDLT